ncbi:AraC family transcriptional regulator [Spirosoma montaniterrae]|uniref:AraC family transcriptional regulator n=1 Tax=Spirosoma montaniterrae TaxID=1178516 RepID=A0A1P9WTY8_9BACT|nr:AraC family transcriptional regulator [Spirosoma montaniterrae]AQG78856.1 AraC family transcriptional regulator [Spirosoma montaniterrae]
MKKPLRKDLEPVAASFIVKELVEPHFDPNWHFHPHYQLFLVEEGTGTRFIGDSIQPFGPGDLVFLGPNLPHLWRSDQPYFDRNSGLITKGIVVYFMSDFLGSEFLNKPEMAPLRQLLAYARQGLEWTGKTRHRAETALQQLREQPVGFTRVLHLLALLDELAHAPDYRFLSSAGYSNSAKPGETDRMQVVHDYVLGHFADEISLETVADLAGMTASAFCRYFKSRANKTFSDFVSEVRIGHACKLLMKGDLSVTQVSYESGFRTLSNFNRQFRHITRQTPSGYRRTYRAM